MSRAQTSRISSLINYPIIINESLLRLIGSFVFIVLMGLGAFIRIPLGITPIPITLQTFFVLLCGAMLGRKFGTFSQMGYVILGVAGVPIFAGATYGLSCLFGPSGGYLLGFMAASFVTGTLLESNRNFLQIVMAFLAATVVIYLFGVIWLAIFIKVSLLKAVFMGMLPFIAGDIIKLVSAAVIYEKLKFKFEN